jgi:hypothetical protein
MNKEEAKSYLVRMEVWDDDLFICALNIAKWIACNNDTKWGKRLIIALVEAR